MKRKLFCNIAKGPEINMSGSTDNVALNTATYIFVRGLSRVFRDPKDLAEQSEVTVCTVCPIHNISYLPLHRKIESALT